MSGAAPLGLHENLGVRDDGFRLGCDRFMIRTDHHGALHSASLPHGKQHMRQQ